MEKQDKLNKPAAIAITSRAIDYTLIHEIRILRPLMVGEVLEFDTDSSFKGLIYKK